MQMAVHSGTGRLFWYFRFDGNFCPDSTEIICDEITKNDFDLCSVLFFPTKSTSIGTDFDV
jgi:hypothetical protein